MAAPIAAAMNRAAAFQHGTGTDEAGPRNNACHDAGPGFRIAAEIGTMPAKREA